jgi:hypothetical protein
MMNDQLFTRWTGLEEAKSEFLTELYSWETEDLSRKPGVGWSAIQVMEHILTAERGTLGYMKKKSSSGWEGLEITGHEHNVSSKAVNERLQSPEKYQAPSVLSEPTGISSLGEHINDWNQLRSEMKDFVESVDPVYYNRLVFRQPIAGMLNLLQALEFMTYHIHHHIPQLHRIKDAIS